VHLSVVNYVSLRKQLLNHFYVNKGITEMKTVFGIASALLIGAEALAMGQATAIGTESTLKETTQSFQIAQVTKTPMPAQPVEVKKPTSAMTFGLADGTRVKMKFKQTVSSKTAKQNDPIEFEVTEDIRIGNTTVIAKGATGRGVVTKVQRSGMLGRKGKLEIAINDVDLTSGERIAVRASQESGGGNSGGVIALAAVINPLFLLMKGKNVTYEAGTETSVFVDGNFQLDQAKFVR
jgi:hypothetical protein